MHARGGLSGPLADGRGGIFVAGRNEEPADLVVQGCDVGLDHAAISRLEWQDASEFVRGAKRPQGLREGIVVHPANPAPSTSADGSMSEGRRYIGIATPGACTMTT